MKGSIWPAQADFQADLLFHLTSRQAEPVPGLPESIRRFQGGGRQDPIYRVLLGFYAGTANPRVRDARGHYGESFTEVASEAYQTLLDACGLRRNAPYTVEHLATTIAALLDGFHMRWIAGHPNLEDPEEEDGWSLATRAALMVFDQFTEPA